MPPPLKMKTPDVEYIVKFNSIKDETMERSDVPIIHPLQSDTLEKFPGFSGFTYPPEEGDK